MEITKMMKRSEMLKQIDELKVQEQKRQLLQEDLLLPALLQGNSGISQKKVLSLIANKIDNKIENKIENKEEYVLGIVSELFMGEIKQGAALKKLRKELLGISQDQYAKLIGLSRKTISDIENDKDNYTIQALETMCKPFGLKVSLIPNRKN